MHRPSINEGLTLYDSCMNDTERRTIRFAQKYHLFTWVLNWFVVGYIIYIIIKDFESVFMGYVIFSVFALLASILYGYKYKSWLGHNILIYFILFVFIIINFIIFAAAWVAEFMPHDEHGSFGRGKHTALQTTLTILFFIIPLLHSLSIILLFSVRRRTENRVLVERGGLKQPHGKQILEYKPQKDDDVEKQLRGSKNLK